MMAAATINQPNPTENLKSRAIAPATKAEHCKCVRCNGLGYTSTPVKEQLEMIWKLQHDYETIYLENHVITDKLKSMNMEMEEFFTKVPLGKILPDEVKVSVVDDKISTKNTCAGITERNEEEHSSWKEKERKLQLQVIHQQKKLIADLMSADRPLVSKELWGHKSRTWPRSSKRKQPFQPSQKPPRSPKPFSIPFCPKPLHLLARKAYLKPPPKLRPLFSNGPPTLPLQCSSVECDKIAEDAQFRELFADALERAVNSNQADHPYYDAFDQGDDDLVTPWADHPYYDDLGISGADQGD